ncbi:hypothetical protein JHK87_020077 [Glycine soja]|nr:hypothetical protein JHK87_020077 [Glycine soja]
MASQESIEKMQARQNYRNLWHTDLMRSIQADTPCNDTLSHTFSIFAFYFYTDIVSDFAQIVASRCGDLMIVLFSLKFCSFGRGIESFIFSFDVYRFRVIDLGLTKSEEEKVKNMHIHIVVYRQVMLIPGGLSAPCVSYLLRKRALYDDMSRYTCCAGYMPCSGRCGESKCPEFCLCTEGFMFCLQQIACIFSIVAMIVGSDEIQEASQLLSCLADFVYCTVCACMQTQHKIEMDKRDGKFGPQPAMAVPPMQQMSRIDQQVPPSVGYAPQPAYGQPAQGYPAPGYPPTGYPPAAYPPPGYPPSGYPK